MNIKCLIIDDEPLAIEVIGKYLQDFQNIEVMGRYNNPIDALPALENDDIDVVFLDISMPKMDGIAFLKALDGKQPHIIITTAYKEHAVESYELNVLDYLVKPIPFSRFLKSMNRLNQAIIKERAPQQTEYNFAQEPHIFLKVDKRLVKILLKDIHFIESLKDYIKIFTPAESYIVHKSLTSIVDELPEENFIRIHKSYAIAIDKVKSVEGNMVEIAEKRVPIGRNYVKHTKDRIFKKTK